MRGSSRAGYAARAAEAFHAAYARKHRWSEPGAAVEAVLARAGAVTGCAMAAGSLLSGGLVAWAPAGDTRSLLLPVLAGLFVSTLFAVLVL